MLYNVPFCVLKHWGFHWLVLSFLAACPCSWCSWLQCSSFPWPQETSRSTPQSASFYPFTSSTKTICRTDTLPASWFRTPRVSPGDVLKDKYLFIAIMQRKICILYILNCCTTVQFHLRGEQWELSHGCTSNEDDPFSIPLLSLTSAVF